MSKKPRKKVLTPEEKKKIYQSIREAAEPVFRFYENWNSRSSARKAIYKLK